MFLSNSCADAVPAGLAKQVLWRSFWFLFQNIFHFLALNMTWGPEVDLKSDGWRCAALRDFFCKPSVWSWTPAEPSCVQIPCLVQRDACGYLSPYIALLCLLTVQNSLTGGEWCCTRPGQPYFKRELSAESVQGQPLHLFLSGNYSYRHPYTKQTPSNTCAAAFLRMLASWRLAKMPWQQMLADLQTKPSPIFPCTRTTPR